MRRVLFGFAALSATLLAAGTARADDWVLRADTSSRACRIELKTAAPIGVQSGDTFSSRKDACDAALKAYDSSMSDTNKCWTYTRGTVDACSSDGVTLPH